MRTYVAAFVVAALIGGALTPLVRVLALRLGAVSVPGGRHIHERSVPRLGGLAILAAFFTPLVGLFFVESVVADVFTGDLARVAGLFVGGAIMCAVGFVDDTRGMRAVHKLLAQVAVAIIAYGFGYRIDAIALPVVGSLSMGVFALPITITWIVGIINAVNLIDGLDGLAAGVVFFASLTLFVVAHIAGVTLVPLLMAAMMGAVVGFLFYNFNPARIFMGDSGSYFLGYVLAVSSLAGVPKASAAVALLVPVLALGVPIFDVLFAMLRRVLERRSIFSPDRGHIHHRLLDVGITHRRAVLIIYGVCLIFALSAIAVYMGRSWQVGLALLTASVVLVGLVRLAGYFEYLRVRREHRALPCSRDAEPIRRALPLLPLALDGTTATAEVLGGLDQFAQAAGIRALELIDRDTNSTLHKWEADASTRREDVSAAYSFGAPRSLELRFTWMSEFGELSPHAQVLLQVAVDVVEAHLVRVRSALVQPIESPDAVADAPARDSVELPSEV